MHYFDLEGIVLLMKKSGILLSLQAGRGFAALSVACFHASLLLADKRYIGAPIFEQFTRLGFRGIDYFFVLSGFIILHAHSNDIGKPERLSAYLWKRFSRVYPIYWLYTAIYVSLVAFGLGTVVILSESALSWASTIALIHLLPGNTPLGVAWTLFHEISFYAFFAILICNKIFGLIAFCVWTVLCLTFLQYPLIGTAHAWEIYTSGYNLNFIIGMAAWCIWNLLSVYYAVATVILGVVVVGVSIAFDYQGISLTLMYAIGFGSLIAGLAGLEKHGALNIHPVLAKLGDASYTLYLVHIPLLGLFGKILSPAHLDTRIYWLVVVAATIGSSILAYAMIEKPLLRIFRSYGTRLATNSMMSDASSKEKPTAK